MNMVHMMSRERPAGVVVADSVEALGAFMDAGSSAAIWRRQTPPDVQKRLDTLAPNVLPRGRVIVPVDGVERAVDYLCGGSGLSMGAEFDWFKADVMALAESFAGVMSAKFLRVRLDVVTTNACRKFHTDVVTARLVCTYRGTGTQYGVSVNQADPKRVYTVQTGAPILLRGSLWPAKPATGLKHRSPPIEGTGETRLVLVLDPIETPDTDSVEYLA